MRYTLRTLLLLVTLFGVTFGLYADRVYRQKRAVKKLIAAGCEVKLDHEFHWDAYPVEPFAPEWIRRIVGDHWASRVSLVKLDYKRSSFTDEEGQYLKDLPHLTILDLWGARVSDRTAQHIAKMKGL